MKTRVDRDGADGIRQAEAACFASVTPLHNCGGGEGVDELRHRDTQRDTESRMAALAGLSLAVLAASLPFTAGQGSYGDCHTTYAGPSASLSLRPAPARPLLSHSLGRVSFPQAHR